MSPSLSLPFDSSHHFGQFRIGTLLLVTAVFAMVAAVARFSFPVGVIASVPLTIALLRTLRIGGRNHGRLPVLFFTSLLSLFSVVAMTVLSIAIGIAVLALTALQAVLRITRAVTDWFQVRSTRSATNGGRRTIRARIISVAAAIVRLLHVGIGRLRSLVQTACGQVGKSTIRKAHEFNA